MRMGSKLITGGCACGNITYTSTARPEHLDYCYCSTCQQVSGAPFTAWMGIPKSNLTWTFKQPPFVYRATVGETGICISERTCCGSCGCNILLQYYLYPAKSHVAASTIRQNDFDPLKVGCHIWCRHVPDWHTIAEDGVERHYEFDDVFKERLERYLKDNKA